jgi:hypothetical protein
VSCPSAFTIDVSSLLLGSLYRVLVAVFRTALPMFYYVPLDLLPKLTRQSNLGLIEVAAIQNMKAKSEPFFLRPQTLFKSLFGDRQAVNQTNLELRRTIENIKDNLNSSTCNVIGTVGKDLFSRVTRIEKMVKHSTIVYRSVSDRIGSNDFVFPVSIDVILVAIMATSIFLHPASISIPPLLKLVRLLFSLFRNFTLLILVFSSQVLHCTGIGIMLASMSCP